MTMEDLPPRDHNEPPELIAHDPVIYADFDEKVEEFNSAAAEWLALKTIETPEQSSKLADFISGGRSLHKDIEAARKDQKAKWDALAKKVHEDYKRLHSRIEKIVQLPSKMQADWLEREQKRIEAEQAERRRAAEEEQRRAEERARQAASRLDAAGMADAEAEVEKARKASEAAAKEKRVKANSATGAGRAMSLRTVKRAEIVSIGKLLTHYRDDPELHECLLRLANRDLRNPRIADESIPGIKIIEERKAV
jgi:chromosome segregation ATPase